MTDRRIYTDETAVSWSIALYTAMLCWHTVIKRLPWLDAFWMRRHVRVYAAQVHRWRTRNVRLQRVVWRRPTCRRRTDIGPLAVFVLKRHVKLQPTNPTYWRRSMYFSERELTFTFAICCRPSVCRLSVTLVHPTQVVEISAVFLWHLVAWPSVDIHWKVHGDRPRGTPPPEELNTRGVAKYSDFGSIDGYISETMQDRR